MPRQNKSAVLGPIAGCALFLGAGVQTAYADFWGGDIPLLTSLVATTAEQLQKASDTLDTLRKTYDSAKRVAGYAEEGYQAYQHFTHYSAQRFGEDALGALDTAFPDISYFRREASRTGAWAQSTGELQSLITFCFSGLTKGTKGTCIELQKALTLRQAREAIQGTFGIAPPVAGSIETRAIDHEASVAMASSASQFERNKLARSEADGLLEQCRDGEGNLAACQAAAGTAQIRQLRASADIADQLAEANRLQAVELSQQNARLKRELNEAAERRQLVLEGTEALGEKPVKMRTDGFEFFTEGH